MGAHLSTLRGQQREQQQMWHQALKMLQSASDLPEGEQLFASLRISYDALKQDQKRMFLDAAFFFLGRRKDTATYAWEGYGPKAKPSPLICFGTLVLVNVTVLAALAMCLSAHFHRLCVSVDFWNDIMANLLC